MHIAVPFLFACPQAAAHAFLETTVLELLAEVDSLFPGGQASDEAVEEIHVRGQVIRGVPFDAADVGRGRDRGPFLREMGGFVGFVVAGVSNLGIGDDVEVMEEDPEDFLGDIDDLVAPDVVRSRRVHLSDELRGPGVFRLGWISKVSKDVPRPDLILSW